MKNNSGKINIATFIGVILILTVVLFGLVVGMKINNKKSDNSGSSSTANTAINTTNEYTVKADGSTSSGTIDNTTVTEKVNVPTSRDRR